ncbi:histone acetyltransferase GCN5 [Cordyceps militaris CM01]|uniref:histone acetyltransferase n=1 Tax=Cordyceps militaris (strain CM01) TaxID=983644 RepID=G3JT24_CORMM|nr:histone acetyltransferase GCN5 [Cordyceps militaris CM01]EGX89020.1 histone acetyltransferase GCN5 [Cordyceps militaris CM01]
MHGLKREPNDHVGAGNATVHKTPHGPVDVSDTAKPEGVPRYPEQAQTGTSVQTHHHARIHEHADTEPQKHLRHQMGRASLQDDEPTFGTKRSASQELSDMDVKRFKADPDEASGQEDAPPTLPFTVPFPDKPAVLEERAGDIEYRVVNNDGSRESTITLTGLKCLFQKQLPKMPKDYIARLVYDRNHLSIAIIKLPLEVIGGICYRPFHARKFAEIVFCAVSSDQQVKGYGAHIMSHLKDYVRATSPVMHFLTYADNYATGYFQKQGFTKAVSLDKALWMGYIKDYEGGTLMQCSMLPRVRYLEAGRMLLKQKEAVLAKIRPLSRSHIVHPPPPQWSGAGGVHPIDPLSIPAIRATGWCPAMDEMARAPRHGPHFTELRRFLYQMQNHKQAWPFLHPVNRDEVPDYYTVIKEPMDLSTMEERLTQDMYTGPQELVRDMKLIFDNCRKYNDATTIYSKCAAKLEKYMWTLVKEVPEWHNLLDEQAS